MIASILDSTKKILGVAADYTEFDTDIIIHINSVFGTLNDLGIGPIDGFMIEDSEATWEDFLAGDNRFNPVKTYMYLRVRLLFDPPTNSFLVSSLQEQIKELEWRLNVKREERDYPYIPELEDVDAGDLGSGSAPLGTVLAADGFGNAEWDPLTRVEVLDPDEEPDPNTIPGTVILKRLS